MTAEVHNCYVAMFDVLGFKALRAHRGTAGVARLYDRSLLPMIEIAAAGAAEIQLNGSQPVLVAKKSDISVECRVISDTVMFFAKSDDLASFISIVNSSSELLKSGFNGSKAPLRGAIGYGDLYISGNITVGSAIEDAYQAEALQVWSGTMFTEKATEHAKSSNYFKIWEQSFQNFADQNQGNDLGIKAAHSARRIIQYDVPLKAGCKAKDAYVLDWTIDVFKDAAQGAFLESTEPNAIQIMKNTIAFEEWARSR